MRRQNVAVPEYISLSIDLSTEYLRDIPVDVLA